MNNYNQPPYEQTTYPPQGPGPYPNGPSYSPPPPQYPQEYNNSAPYPPQPQQEYPPMGENASYYNTGAPDQRHSHSPQPPQDEDEKGLGSTVIGGAAGGYLGHQMGGKMSTLGGAALGALGLNALNHKLHKPEQSQVNAVPMAGMPMGGMPMGGMPGNMAMPMGGMVQPVIVPMSKCKARRMRRHQRLGFC
ncbi:hypothetical protein ASPWEDRAFT_31198 [Aspergillus wentii DTO 134E9]|uniref:Glycine zipper 2TM domain-containing protein n=1 Tax=Aspergillus wentii DTO 134E9 TaxID=1073089 RepID=A0A1L9RBN8_ASPWE|nr:uncharacterized protein ASPWEDRAFT_31198 [Aspergillus wentii DTO 134E9]KAI9934842.1 hypothetical protein MW887_000462 [Aspergillus wentii]OJJ32277.1 hypothetical protein ASPWEDRAFT_31198 [Aspergillus wentii DTO 134E9]